MNCINCYIGIWDLKIGGPVDNDIEMMLGAILVQNTRWRNAEIALNQIKEHTHFNPNHILEPPIGNVTIIDTFKWFL